MAFSYDNYDKPTIIELPIENISTTDVYTLSGSKIRSKVDALHATDGLQHGIYIVGGKKIVK